MPSRSLPSPQAEGAARSISSIFSPHVGHFDEATIHAAAHEIDDWFNGTVHTPPERSRVLTPVELALETAILFALSWDMNGWAPNDPATLQWNRLVAGAKVAGMIGYIYRKGVARPVALYELYGDEESEYIGLVGDGQGDLFALHRDNVSSVVMF